MFLFKLVSIRRDFYNEIIKMLVNKICLLFLRNGGYILGKLFKGMLKKVLIIIFKWYNSYGFIG